MSPWAKAPRDPSTSGSRDCLPIFMGPRGFLPWAPGSPLTAQGWTRSSFLHYSPLHKPWRLLVASLCHLSRASALPLNRPQPALRGSRQPRTWREAVGEEMCPRAPGCTVLVLMSVCNSGHPEPDAANIFSGAQVAGGTWIRPTFLLRARHVNLKKSGKAGTWGCLCERKRGGR